MPAIGRYDERRGHDHAGADESAVNRILSMRLPFLAFVLWVGSAETGAAMRPLLGDIDCDGRVDTISYVVTPETLGVEIKFSQQGRPSEVLTFQIGAETQGSFCAVPVKASLESLDFDPKAEGLGALPGFRRSGVCKGIVRYDQRCDAIHVYWDHDAGRLSWWRY